MIIMTTENRSPGAPDPGQPSHAVRSPGFPTPADQERWPPDPPAAEPTHQFMTARQLREQFGRATPYTEGRRIGYGLLWAAWTLILAIGGFGLLFGGSVFSGLLGLVLAFFAGRYDYRIWSWQAKRLLFLIIW